MNKKKQMNKPVAAMYFGLMTVLGFMVLVGPSAASPVAVNMAVTGAGISESQYQYSSSLPFTANTWAVNPYTLTGPTISQNGNAFKMSGMQLACDSPQGCGEISISAYLSGVQNPGVFKVDFDGTASVNGCFSDTGIQTACAFGIDGPYLTGNWWASAWGPGINPAVGPLGVSGNLTLYDGAFQIGPFYSPNLSILGSPFSLGFGFTIDSMGWGDSITLANSFNINVNSPRSPVPEPTSMALFAGGLIGLGLLRRKLYKRE